MLPAATAAMRGVTASSDAALMMSASQILTFLGAAGALGSVVVVVSVVLVAAGMHTALRGES